MLDAGAHLGFLPVPCTLSFVHNTAVTVTPVGAVARVGRLTDAAPVANDDLYSMRAGGTLVVDAPEGLLANDSDADGTFDATSFSSPGHGQLGVSLTGAITYTPDPGFVATDSFTYYVSDGTETAFAVAYVDYV
jgi:hypothetical protein